MQILTLAVMKKCGNYGPPFEVFRYATASPIFSVESRTSEECVDCRPFFCFPIRATLTIVVVEPIELDPSNNSAREGLRLPTCGPLTKTVAHPCFNHILFHGLQIKSLYVQNCLVFSVNSTLRLAA